MYEFINKESTIIISFINGSACQGGSPTFASSSEECKYETSID